VVRPSPIRLTSALVALVWITAPLAAVFHGLAEAHRYCAEHRGFEEATAATETTDRHAGNHDQLDQARPSDDSEDHHACAFHVAWRSDQTLRGPDLQAAPVLQPAEVAPVSLEAPRLTDVLASAPKTSPPHLAA